MSGLNSVQELWWRLIFTCEKENSILTNRPELELFSPKDSWPIIKRQRISTKVEVVWREHSTVLEVSRRARLWGFLPCRYILSCAVLLRKFLEVVRTHPLNAVVLWGENLAPRRVQLANGSCILLEHGLLDLPCPQPYPHYIPLC